MNSQQIREKRERFLKYTSSADIYDVMDKMGYENQCLDITIKPFKDDWKVCGPAVTIMGTREPLTDEELHPEPFDKFAVFKIFYEGCVVVINGEKDDVCGHWGEMMSYGARNCGAVGVVIDGGTRDKAGILKIENWTCFAKYSTPVESLKRWRPKETMRPIYMSGTLTKNVRVNPGDWIFGDCDAVMVIPQEIVYRVLDAVEDVSACEVLSRKAFNEGKSMHEVFKLYNRA
ncbi:MAG: RraA family protein [Actinobacteria bacterium]|nr:RraA family protein [Actinomycetota bacterium]